MGAHDNNNDNTNSDTHGAHAHQPEYWERQGDGTGDEVRPIHQFYRGETQPVVQNARGEWIVPIDPDTAVRQYHEDQAGRALHDAVAAFPATPLILALDAWDLRQEEHRLRAEVEAHGGLLVPTQVVHPDPPPNVIPPGTPPNPDAAAYAWMADQDPAPQNATHADHAHSQTDLPGQRRGGHGGPDGPG